MTDDEDDAMTTPTLWHYTCDHGLLKIGARGWLKPGADSWLWLTDLDVPHRDALGLSSVLIECDRTAHRYRVEPGHDAHPFVRMQHAFDPVRWQALLDVPGGLVRHWYVSAVPVRATLEDITPAAVRGWKARDGTA